MPTGDRRTNGAPPAPLRGSNGNNGSSSPHPAPQPPRPNSAPPPPPNSGTPGPRRPGPPPPPTLRQQAQRSGSQQSGSQPQSPQPWQLTRLISDSPTVPALAALTAEHGPRFNGFHVTALVTRLAALAGTEERDGRDEDQDAARARSGGAASSSGASAAASTSARSSHRSRKQPLSNASRADEGPVGSNSHQQQQPPAWLPLAQEALCLVELHAASLDGRGVANIAWGLAKLAARHPPGLARASSAAVSRLFALPAAADPRVDLSPHQLANSLWAAAALRAALEPAWLAAALEAAASALARGGMREDGVSMLLWALSELRVAPPDGWMAEMYAAVRRQAGEMSYVSAANVLLSLARMVAGGEGEEDEVEEEAEGARQAGRQRQAVLAPTSSWLAGFLYDTSHGLSRADPPALANSAWALAKLAAASRERDVQAAVGPGMAGEAGLVVPARWLHAYYAALASSDTLQRCSDQQLSLVLWSLASLASLPGALPLPPPAPLLAAAATQALPRLPHMGEQSFALASWGLARLQHGGPTHGSEWRAAWAAASRARLGGLGSRGLLCCLQAAAAWRLEACGGEWLGAAREAVMQSRHTAAARPALLTALVHATEACAPLGDARTMELLEAVAAAVLAGAEVAAACSPQGEGEDTATHGLEGERAEASSSSTSSDAAARDVWSASELLRCGAALARAGYLPPPAWRAAFFARVASLGAALPQPPAAADQHAPPSSPSSLAPAAPSDPPSSLQLTASSQPPAQPSTSSSQHVHARALKGDAGLTARDLAQLLACSRAWGAAPRPATLDALLGAVPRARWAPGEAAAVCRLLALTCPPAQGQGQAAGPGPQDQPGAPEALERGPQGLQEAQLPHGPQRVGQGQQDHAAVGADGLSKALVVPSSERAPRDESPCAPDASRAAAAGPGSSQVPLGGRALQPHIEDTASLESAGPVPEAHPREEGPGQRQPLLQRGPGRPAGGSGSSDGSMDGGSEDGAGPILMAQRPVLTPGSGPGPPGAGQGQGLGPGPVPQSPAVRFVASMLDCATVASLAEAHAMAAAAAAAQQAAAAAQGGGDLHERRLSGMSAGSSSGSGGASSTSRGGPSTSPSRPVASGLHGFSSHQTLPLERPWPLPALALLAWSAQRLRLRPSPAQRRGLAAACARHLHDTHASARDLLPLLWAASRLRVPPPPRGLLAAALARPDLAPDRLTDWQLSMALEVVETWRAAPPPAWMLALRDVLLRRLQPAARCAAGAEGSSGDGQSGKADEGLEACGECDAVALLQVVRRVLTYLGGLEGVGASSPEASGSSDERPPAPTGPAPPAAGGAAQAGVPGAAAPALTFRERYLTPLLLPALRARTAEQLRLLFGVTPHAVAQRAAARPASSLPTPAPASPPGPSAPRQRLAALLAAHRLGLLAPQDWSAWGLPALQRLAHELPPALYPPWLRLVSALGRDAPRASLEDTLLAWCLASGEQMPTLSPSQLHRTLRAAGRASRKLHLSLSPAWASSALALYAVRVAALPGPLLAEVPGVLLGLRRCPPPRWQAAYVGLVARRLRGIGLARAVRLVHEAGALSPEMGGALRGAVREYAAAAAARR